MKKRYRSLLVAILSTFSFSVASANPEQNSHYFSTLQSKAKAHVVLKANLKSSPVYYPTDIEVVNTTLGNIHVSVPNTPITDDLIFPVPHGLHDHIRNDIAALNTTIEIRDAYNQLIRSVVACPRALVIAYGQTFPGQGGDVFVDDIDCR